MRKRSRALAGLAGREAALRESSDELEAREALLHIWGLKGVTSSPFPLAEHCWHWLTGRDLDGRPIIWTTDERDERAPLKPFPDDKPYLRLLVDWALGEPKDLQLDKARQMMATTTLVLVADWVCRALSNRKVILSKSKREEAEKILEEKVRHVHFRLPEWVQTVSPIGGTKSEIRYRATGSLIMGVAQNFAVREARGNTASIVIVDEAAYQRMLADILAGVMPMASRLWFLSTAAGGPGGHTFNAYLKGENERQ